MRYQYGCPPREEDCVPGSPPENLVVKTSPGIIPPNTPQMHCAEGLGRKASAVAVARQLNKAYDFGRDQPVKIEVTGYGTFLLGPEGWCLK